MSNGKSEALRNWIGKTLETVLSKNLRFLLKGCEIKVTIEIKPLTVIDGTVTKK